MYAIFERNNDTIITVFLYNLLFFIFTYVAFMTLKMCSFRHITGLLQPGGACQRSASDPRHRGYDGAFRVPDRFIISLTNKAF